MALFRKVTLHDGQETFINFDLITHVEEDKKSGTTRVSFDSDNYIFVKEAPALILSGLYPDPIFKKAAG